MSEQWNGDFELRRQQAIAELSEISETAKPEREEPEQKKEAEPAPLPMHKPSRPFRLDSDMIILILIAYLIFKEEGLSPLCLALIFILL